MSAYSTLPRAFETITRHGFSRSEWSTQKTFYSNLFNALVFWINAIRQEEKRIDP